MPASTKRKTAAPANQLSPAILPPAAEPAAEAPARSAGSKLDGVIALLRRPKGARMAELIEATGWQAHSVRGALSGAIKKKLGLPLTSTPSDAGRVYRIAEEPQR